MKCALYRRENNGLDNGLLYTPHEEGLKSPSEEFSTPLNLLGTGTEKH